MSDLLNSASLVMIPSGYKEDVVYSQIPTDGSGDLSFTRASNGTRINSAGLVEVCPWNLLEQSETFDNAVWSKTGVTVTANSVAAPNGTTTADTLVFGASSNEIVQSVGNLIVDQTYTLTIYLRVASGTATMYWGNIDYTTPSITVTTEWQRFTVTQQAAATTRYPKLVSSSGVTVYAWGAQLNIGSTAKPYFPTTDRLNVPRLTYQNGGGGCPSLLLEKQSTNLVTYSEDINNSFTSKVGVTITSNNTISPDGTQNADLLKFDTTSGYALRSQTVNATTTYTMSVFVKNNNFTSGQLLTFNMSDGVIGGLTAQIDVVAKTATYSGAGSAWTSVSGKVEDYGNGWFRVSVTGTSIGGGGGWYEMAASGVTNSCYVWGLSLEQSSYVTSYIPTTSSSATRVADECKKTGISSLIGQTEGTIFWNVSNFTQYSNDGARFFVYADANNFILISPYGTTLRVLIVSSGTAFDNFMTISGDSLKIAVAYKANDYKFYVNGNSIGTPSVTSVPAMSAIGIFNDFGVPVSSQSETKELILFPTRLTNAELASLTTI